MCHRSTETIMHHCFLFVLWLCGSTCGHRVWHTGLTVCCSQQWWSRSNDPGNDAACGHTVQVWEQHKLWVTSNYLPTLVYAGLCFWVIVCVCVRACVHFICILRLLSQTGSRLKQPLIASGLYKWHQVCFFFIYSCLSALWFINGKVESSTYRGKHIKH